jgi:hypothetical protein
MDSWFAKREIEWKLAGRITRRGSAVIQFAIGLITMMLETRSNRSYWQIMESHKLDEEVLQTMAAAAIEQFDGLI